jgi:threonyl-tRNA synthetase
MFVTLPDGKKLELSEHSTPKHIAEAIGPGLAKVALGAKVNGKLSDLMTEVPDGAHVSIVTKKDDESILLSRHTLAHVMAQAAIDYFVGKGFKRGDVKMGVGPVIENGFYYDFDVPEAMTPEDLEAIEAQMRELVNAKLPLRKYSLSREEALERYQKIGDPYKVELIQDLPVGETLTFYEQGGEAGFTDLCRGPHVPNTSDIPPHFKLMSVAGAYWRGDEKRQQLQRIYGVAFKTKEELEKHLWILEEAKRRDHRKIGRELELFLLDPMVGKGLPMWLPKGNILREQLITFLRDEQSKRGYQLVTTPNIGSVELYKMSGHFPYYADSQFPLIDLSERNENEVYMLKPMNCPHHTRIFSHKLRSYRDLPLRIAEFGTVYRYEKSGELNGLTRVRGFTQDDAHIFCTPEQVKQEFLAVLELVLLVFSSLQLSDYRVRVGTRDPGSDKYVGSDEVWTAAEKQIIEACEEAGLNYTVEPGDAAFYGPKLDFVVKDVLRREWQLGTIQVDYNLPERFTLSYTGADGLEHRPVMIHRAPFGSLERFIGILIEHFAGDFPLWLAPEQIRLVPIADRHAGYAYKLKDRFAEVGLRSEVDSRSERMNAKVRDAELYKVPYIVIVGDQEEASNQVSFRSRQEPNQNAVSTDIFIQHLKENMLKRSLEIEPIKVAVA